jgi:serine/threonine protein kinase
MKLKIINPEGVHAREIKGLDVLEKALPDHWFGYAAFELIGHDGGEIDLMICADDRLLLVEIKDWNLPITDNGATWTTPKFTIKSPVVLSSEKSRKLGSKLTKFFSPKYRAPLVDHCVLFTGSSKRSSLNEDTREKVFEMEFFKTLGGKGTFQKCFPNRASIDIPRDILKQQLDLFFSGGRIRPLQQLYNGYRAEDSPRYTHPQSIYREYFAELEGAKGYKALLRKWDFEQLGNIDPVYRTTENFEAIALREQGALGYLNEKNPGLADRNAFLEPISNEGPRSITLNFFELYKLPHNLSRLKEALARYGSGLKDEHRLSLARLLLHHFSEIHEINVAHRDVGEHCIWVNIPDKVSLSGFATSSFPEQNTVAQIRNTIRAGSERIPEELMDAKSDNYRKDVFLLGAVIHQILFGEKAATVDGVPMWQTPKSGKFEKLWGWLERALEFEPAKRFPNAKVAFEEFQRCNAIPTVPHLSADDFREFQRHYPPMPDPARDQIIRSDSEAVVFRRGDRLIKLWSNAKFNAGDFESNFHLLEFFNQIQRLKSSRASSQQEILDFGMTIFGSYVELKWSNARTLDEFNGESFVDADGLAFISAIVRAVEELHRSKFYHGDLKPGNILYSHSEEGFPLIQLIDLVDFSQTGTVRRTSAYLPPQGEEATTPACDGYALKKIITDFLFPRMPGVTLDLKNRITAILEDMLNPDAGIPDLKGFLDELDNMHASNDDPELYSCEDIIISMGGIEHDLLMIPDDRGLPVTITQGREAPDSFIIRINDSALCLNLSVNSTLKKITKLWIQTASILDLVQSLSRSSFLIKRPIRILKSRTDDLTAMTDFLNEVDLFGIIEERYQQLKRDTNEDDPLEFFAKTEMEEDGEDKNEVTEIPPVMAPLADLSLNLFWEALLEAEASVVPVVVTTGEPVEIKSSGILVCPVSDPSTPFDPQDDEHIEVQTQDSERKWRYFGRMDTRNSRNGRLSIVPHAMSKFRPTVGTAMRLENKASRASYDKRLAAAQRILSNHGVCSNLFDYIIGLESISPHSGRFSNRLEKLDQYGLNADQKEALVTALSCAPLSLIQGPPGTGKTRVISAAVHYIATNYPTAKILVVSQSHEAIDHATEQIVKRFRVQGDDPSLVRVGRRAAVSDNLISFHSESLQGEYRERFRLSLTQRVLPLSRRLGLSEIFAESLAVLRARLAPILQQLLPKQSDEDNEIDTKLVRYLENACRQLDPGFDFSAEPLSSVYELMEHRLVERYQETDQQAVNALRGIIDLGLEWVQILETPGKLDRFYVRSCQIVTGTCVGVGRWQLGLENETFDCVIIDEAARCGPGDLAVACQVAHQVILVGDHKQLPPFLEKEVVSKVASELSCPTHQVERSDFQRLFESPYASQAGRTLKTQYRMKEPIGRLVSTCFYPETGGIDAGRENSPDCYNQLPERISQDVTWIDSGDGGEERLRTSFINRFEIDKIMQVLEEIDRDQHLVQGMIDDADAEGLPAAIGIIAAYKAQAEAIEERIWQSSLSIKLRQTCKVGTVDSYQGKENSIVIFSAVRCNPHDEIGFTRSWERVNVSLSRARERLIIVGSWNFWEKIGDHAPLGKVVNYISSRLAESDEGYGLNTEKL